MIALSRHLRAGGLLFVLLVAPLTTALAQSPSPCKSTVSGDLRLHSLASRIFGNTRTIRVLVPPAYDAPENAGVKYPVLYMLDGQNLFDACLSPYSHAEWGVDETVYRLIRERTIPPMIVVGVDHAGKDRAREFLPYKDYWNEGMGETAGMRFPDFLTSEVMPLVDGQYRTLTGHDHTGIGGSSYGGIAALYALLAKPNQFGFGLIESPSLTVGNGEMLRQTNPFVASPIRVVLGMGGRETGADTVANAKYVRLIRQLEANLRSAGYDDTRLRTVVDPEAIHSEPAWAKRLPAALTFLYGTPQR